MARMRRVALMAAMNRNGRSEVPRSARYDSTVRKTSMMIITSSRSLISVVTAIDEQGNLQGGNDAYAQTRYVLDKIDRALHEAGASVEDVVRTRIYVARLDDWRDVARAHGEVFGSIRPANTLIQVAGLVDGR